MRQIDLPAQVEQLRLLARGFEALHGQVRDLRVQPGAAAHRQLTPLILEAHELTAKALARLMTLDESQFTATQASRPSLQLLASVVHSASQAATDLAAAVHANPQQGIGFPGPPVDEVAARQARHAEAAPVMAEHIADAAHLLGVAATACHYMATGLSKTLAAAPQASLPSSLSSRPQRR